MSINRLERTGEKVTCHALTPRSCRTLSRKALGCTSQVRMTSVNLNPDIIADVKQVAERLGTSTLARSEYVQHGRFSLYQIYDGGSTWEDYCRAANLQTKKIEEVPDEVYFGRLIMAIKELGRLPKASERKRFGLNFSKRRFSTLSAFIQAARERGVIEGPQSDEPNSATEANHARDHHDESLAESLRTRSHRTPPPIPAHTNRTKWERIDVAGFPYAPQDELGTVALFGILCSQGIIQWEILDLNGGRGIDCICWDHVMNKEVRIEIKHTLTRAGWNHPLDDLDYVVCWENRWPDFPKPVIAIRTLVESAHRG